MRSHKLLANCQQTTRTRFLALSRSCYPLAMSDASPAPTKLYMVVEHFKDAPAVYRRFRDRGRMAPAGLGYVSSWIDEKIERCYQVMETRDRRLLNEWMANWADLTDFEVIPVITSKEAAEKIEPRL